ncbi:MAG: hypothetical protein A2X77_02785 [Gammaproteobacteria bacterium GWE2_42_36]|nr:MAG: hypothetical protein A2X77_02785 [Gammaproteobacteria bacterium GWE2_42_36]HCU05187.1 hypothetical protein [Coxiellaceae bacterium]
MFLRIEGEQEQKMRSIFPANARQEAELGRCVRMTVQEKVNRIEEENHLPSLLQRMRCKII